MPRLVWTRVREQTREAQEVQEAVRREVHLPELATRLSDRVAYSEAIARGLSADEWLDRIAHGEVRALADEVRSILKEKKR